MPKVFPVHAMKSYRGNEVQLLHSSPPYWIEVSGHNHAPAALLPRKISRHQLNRKLGGVQRQSGHTGREKNLTSTGIQAPEHPAHSQVTILSMLSHLPKICYCQCKFTYPSQYICFTSLQNTHFKHNGIMEY